MGKERKVNGPNPISLDELKMAINRVNLGTVGGDISQSNDEVLAAHEVILSYVMYYPLGEERRTVQKAIDEALGIDEPEEKSDSNYTEGAVGNGTRDTGIITPTSWGTGLSRQQKRPRDI